jgi:excinuclease ABC subunit B
LHSEIATIERAEIIDALRGGKFDVLVGINLLREGLDLPEVSLIAILDADKEGFLRSDTAMIQTIGRAARNEHGRVIMYADRITDSMQRAIDETNRRREKQEAYNKEHNITPKTVYKEQRQLIKLTKVAEESEAADYAEKALKKKSTKELNSMAKELERRMQEAAKALDFELAAELRDRLILVKGKLGQKLVPKKKK